MITVKNGEPLRVIGFDVEPQKILVKNDGYNVKFKFTYGENQNPILHGGPLSSRYELLELHYHFGQTKSSIKNAARGGSEHLIDGTSFEGEMHIVFKNVKYDVEEATQHPDGIAVLTRFLSTTIKLSQNTHLMIAKLSQIFGNVAEIDAKIELEGAKTFSLYEFFGNLNFDFFTYNGGLTTPDCEEAVTFIIANKILKIRPEDLLAFQKVHGFENYLAPNYRPVQPIGKRKVYYYDF